MASFCTNCGTELRSSTKFCSRCGAAVSDAVVDVAAPGERDRRDSSVQSPAAPAGEASPLSTRAAAPWILIGGLSILLAFAIGYWTMVSRRPAGPAVGASVDGSVAAPTAEAKVTTGQTQRTAESKPIDAEASGPQVTSASDNTKKNEPAAVPILEAVAAVLDFDEYVQAGYRGGGRPSLDLVRLWPLLIFSDSRWESLMVSASVGLGPQPYQERLRLVQSQAREKLSRLQRGLSVHQDFSVYVKGEERGTFAVSRCVIDDQRGDWRFRCEGTLRFTGREPEDVQASLATAVALSPRRPQAPFWRVQLAQEQQTELDRATSAILARAQTFVRGQHQVREKTSEVVAVDTNLDGRPEVFRRVASSGQPCGEMSASLLGTWSGSSWMTLRSSISLSECTGTEAAGEDSFSPVFVDIDGDGTAEILMTEGRHESHEWYLYRFVSGSLQRVLRIGAYGS